MQHKTPIGSRIAWFLAATVIFASTWLIGLRVLPAFRDVYASFGIKLPIGTRAVFAFGPAVLVLVGLIVAVILVMGEFRPALRWVRAPLILLVVFLLAASLATAVPPMSMSCPP